MGDGAYLSRYPLLSPSLLLSSLFLLSSPSTHPSLLPPSPSSPLSSSSPFTRPAHQGKTALCANGKKYAPIALAYIFGCHIAFFIRVGASCSLTDISASSPLISSHPSSLFDPQLILREIRDSPVINIHSL